MKHFICLLILSSLFICPACAGGQDLSRFDLSTDEGVTAAREAASGKKLDDYSKGCIKRSPQLPKAVVVGSFAHDRGCDFQGVFLGSRYYEDRDAGLSRSALNFLGWQKARQQEREKLALTWVKDGLLAFLTVLTERDEDFQGREFQPPLSVSDGSGAIVVTLWVRQPPGMTRDRVSERLEYRFSKDGDATARNVLETFVR